MDMKYKLTSETKVVDNITLHRIECVTAFGDVECGDKGGWIESYNNLSQEDNAWVYGNATVYGNAMVRGNSWVGGNATVYGNAWVYGDAVVCENAKVYGDSKVYGDAWVYGDSKVYGDAWVYGDAEVYGDAWVCGDADYIVFKNWWSSGRYFTWTRSNNKWKVGCFFGSGEELIAKAYKDSKKSGREYERVVKYVESILKEDNDNGNRNGCAH